MDIIQKLQSTIKTTRTSHQPHSKSIFYTDTITPDIMAGIERWYTQKPTTETVLLLTNKIKNNIWGYLRTGICITDKAIYCRLQADSYLSSLTLRRSLLIIPLSDVKSIRLGKTDHCYGNSYEGHQLIINEKVVGLIRMGTNIFYDEDMITDLRRIFKAFQK